MYIAVLVNNAASDDRHAIESVTQEYWDNCQSIILIFSAQAVVEGMKAINVDQLSICLPTSSC